MLKPVDLDFFDHCALLLEESQRLREKTEQITVRQNASVTDFIWLEVQTAHTFLNAAMTTKIEATKRRCLRKALCAHDVVVRFLGQQEQVHSELRKALDELMARYESLAMELYPG